MAKTPSLRAPLRIKMFAVLRDDEIYLIRPTKALATKQKNEFELNRYSKHQWRVAPVLVTPMFAART